MNPTWYRWNTPLGDNKKNQNNLDEFSLRKYIPKYAYPKDHPEETARRQKQKQERQEQSLRNENT